MSTHNPNIPGDTTSSSPALRREPRKEEPRFPTYTNPTGHLVDIEVNPMRGTRVLLDGVEIKALVATELEGTTMKAEELLEKVDNLQRAALLFAVRVNPNIPDDTIVYLQMPAGGCLGSVTVGDIRKLGETIWAHEDAQRTLDLHTHLIATGSEVVIESSPTGKDTRVLLDGVEVKGLHEVASLKDRKFIGKVLHDILTVLIEQEGKKDMEQDNAKVTPISDFEDDLDYTAPLNLGHALERIDDAIKGACLTAGKLQHMKRTNDVLKKLAGTFTDVARAVSEELNMHAHDTEYAAKAIAQKYNRPGPKEKAPAEEDDNDDWKDLPVESRTPTPQKSFKKK